MDNQSSLFGVPLSDTAIKLISENTSIVNKNIGRWILAEKNIESGIAGRVLDMLTFAKRRNNIGQKHLKMNAYRKQLIEELVRAGNNMAQFKGVVHFKIKEWKGTSFETHITPETLFNKKKFPKYLEAARDQIKEYQETIQKGQNAYQDLLQNP